VAKVDSSGERGTWPSSRDFSSFLGDAGSVFSRSLSSLTLHSDISFIKAANATIGYHWRALSNGPGAGHRGKREKFPPLFGVKKYHQKKDQIME
jgi:hypothetical protein